ncbi:hypothetical protein D3C73_1345440 [compost metagenome]
MGWLGRSGLILRFGPVLGEDGVGLAVVDSLRIVLQPLPTHVRDAVVSLDRAVDPVGARQVAEDPAHALLVPETTRVESLLPRSLREPCFIGGFAEQILSVQRCAIAECLQNRNDQCRPDRYLGCWRLDL